MITCCITSRRVSDSPISSPGVGDNKAVTPGRCGDNRGGGSAAAAGRRVRPYADDGVLEIVAFTHGLSMGCIMGCNRVLGTRAVRVMQATELRLEIRNGAYMQMDGEPWFQPKCIVQIALEEHKAAVLRSVA